MGLRPLAFFGAFRFGGLLENPNVTPLIFFGLDPYAIHLLIYHERLLWLIHFFLLKQQAYAVFSAFLYLPFGNRTYLLSYCLLYASLYHSIVNTYIKLRPTFSFLPLFSCWYCPCFCFWRRIASSVFESTSSINIAFYSSFPFKNSNLFPWFWDHLFRQIFILTQNTVHGLVLEVLQYLVSMWSLLPLFK